MNITGTNPVRSPAYPSMGLRDAIASVAKIYAPYRLANVDRTVAAKLLGYSGMNGPAAKSQAALAHYGLVQRAGKGEMRVTDRAKIILYPNSEEERLDCLRDAASEPDLFRELQERFPDMIPPEDGVVAYLHRKGFNQSAIRPAAKAFLETMLFLEEERVSESRGAADINPQESALSDDRKDIMATDIEIPRERIPALLAAMPARGVVNNVFMNESPSLNKIGMNVQGHLVHIEAMLDYDGLLALEKKIQGLKNVIDRIGKEESDEAETG